MGACGRRRDGGPLLPQHMVVVFAVVVGVAEAVMEEGSPATVTRVAA